MKEVSNLERSAISKCDLQFLIKEAYLVSLMHLLLNVFFSSFWYAIYGSAILLCGDFYSLEDINFMIKVKLVNTL